MKKILAIIVAILCLSMVGQAFSMGLHIGKKNKNMKWHGPWLYGVSENASFFNVDVNGKIFMQMANEKNELVMFLPDLGLEPGHHDFSIAPCNINGCLDYIDFIIEMEQLGKYLQRWEIILLEEMMDNKEYVESFSENIETTVRKY